MLSRKSRRILQYIKKHNHYPETTDEEIILKLFEMGYIHDLYVYDCECEITEEGIAYLEQKRADFIRTLLTGLIIPIGVVIIELLVQCGI